jgi:Helix-turn-helix domain of resolvase
MAKSSNADVPYRLVQTRRMLMEPRSAAEGFSRLGRTPKLMPHQQREPIRRRDNGETVRDIGRSYNVSHSTIFRLTD